MNIQTIIEKYLFKFFSTVSQTIFFVFTSFVEFHCMKYIWDIPQPHVFKRAVVLWNIRISARKIIFYIVSGEINEGHFIILRIE